MGEGSNGPIAYTSETYKFLSFLVYHIGPIPFIKLILKSYFDS